MSSSSTFSSILVLALGIAACGDDSAGSGGSGSGSGGGGAASTTQGPTTSVTASGSGSSTTTGSGDGGGGAVGGFGGAGGAGGATSSTGEGGFGGEGAGGDPTGSGGGFECGVEDFQAASQDAFNLGTFLGYLAIASAEPPSDDLAIELYSDLSSTGERTIQDENYATCDPCVLFRRDCDENLSNCSQRFLAREGTIEIDEIDGTLAGRLRDLVLVEVTIDEDSNSTEVVDGEILCIDSYDFSAEIQSGGNGDQG